MPYLTLTEKSKVTTKPVFVISYNIQPGNGVGLFWGTHTDRHACLLTYLLGPIWGKSSKKKFYIILVVGD